MKTFNPLSINIPADVYNRLNRAHREYDMAINDAYYYILNGGRVEDPMFESIFNDAFDRYYEYSNRKDEISNDFVIPSIKKEYNLTDNTTVSNYWTVNFDSSYKCIIKNITAKENTEEVIYDEPIDDKWIQDVADIHNKLNVYDAIIERLLTNIKNGVVDTVNAEYLMLRDRRIKLSITEDENKAKFMKEVIDPIISDEDSSKCTWNLNPVKRTLTITRNNA